MLSSTETSKVTGLIFACIIVYTHYIRGMLARLLESRLVVLYKKTKGPRRKKSFWLIQTSKLCGNFRGISLCCPSNLLLLFSLSLSWIL